MELQEVMKEQIKDKRVLDIIDNSIDIIKSLGYKIYNNLDFVWDNKRHSFGTCYVPTSEEGNFTIALNKYLVDEPDENIENVVCHELTHYIINNENILSGKLHFKNGKWYFNKKDYDKAFDSSHGKNWQEIANNISSKIRTTIHPSDNYDFHKEVGTKMKETSKYIVRCKNCGWEDGYVRRTSFVSNPNTKSKNGDWYLYQCPKCKAKGEFEVVTNESLNEDLFEGSIEDEVISTLRTLGYDIKYMKEGWYDEHDTPIDDWEDERDEPEDDWWYIETPYYRCASNSSQVEFSWRIDEYDKTFTIVGVYANYKGSIQGFASRTINDILEILPKDYTIQISNNINKPYWNHMKNKYSRYDWVDIKESLELNEEHLKDSVSSAFDVECIQDNEEFMSLDKSYKQEYYKLIKEWNNLNAKYKEIIDKLNKFDYSLNDYNNPNSDIDDNTRALWKESREINKEALDVWYKIEDAIERAKEQFNNDGESNVQITITSQNLDHYVNKYFLPMGDDEIIKACSLITYDDVQEDAPIYLLPNGKMIGEDETHSSFLEIIFDNVFSYLFGDRFIKDYDMYDCEDYVYIVTKKKNWARLNCGQTPYENRFYCVLPEEMTSSQWYSLEKFLLLGETLKIKNNEVLVYVNRDSHIYSYDEYAYEDILKRIKRYYSSGRFFESLSENNNTFKMPTSNKSINNAISDLRELGYEIKTISIERLVKDNDLLNDKLFNYHIQDWGENPKDYIFGDYEIQYWKYSDVISCTYKNGKYILDNGKHRVRALYNCGYKYIEILTLSDKKKIIEQLLLEKTRAELLNKSKHADNYVDTSKGRNRYERRLKSKVANNIYMYNKIDMNDFFKKDILTIGIDVKGETNNYIVTMKFQGVLKEIQNEVKSNNGKLEFKVITRSMSRVYNSGDVKLWCTCPDWRYRQSFWASKGGYATQIELRPSDITNPHDSKGGGCKHSLLVMSNLDWMMKVSSVIFNYIKYSQKNLETNYANYIFPKIYGMPYNRALQLDLFDSGLLPSDQETLTKIASINLKNKDEKGRFIKGNDFRFKSTKSKEDNKEDDTYFNIEKDRKGRNVLTYPIDKNRNNLGRFIKGNQVAKKPTSIKQTFGNEKKKQIVPNKEEEEK